MLKKLLPAFAVALFAMPLLAEDNPGKDKAKVEPKDEKSKEVEKCFKDLDKDGDGKITKEEFGGCEEVFKVLDKNNDGVISHEDCVERKRTEEEKESIRREWKIKREKDLREKGKEEWRKKHEERKEDRKEKEKERDGKHDGKNGPHGGGR